MQKKTWDERLISILVELFLLGLFVMVMDFLHVELTWETGAIFSATAVVLAVILVVVVGIAIAFRQSRSGAKR